ncbi:MAG: iron-sulfur cluster repair di-iron protein [Bacteroidota bacterium]|nr:iron-sulfur cluster repair di-iron protein [Bacteroidota bacterium]
METVTENILNVTLLPPRQKHPAIFARFDLLREGESLTLHNDHDPKPLYYQLLGERGDIFTWEYLEQGPECWKVQIGKRITGANGETLGQIAAKDLRKAEVFKKYGLDFCCGGKKTVREACKEKGIDATRVEEELQHPENLESADRNSYNEWSLGFLADFIVNNHHNYIRKNLPELRGYAEKCARVHGAHHPELLSIKQLVEQVNDELLDHLEHEERILFPYIKSLEHADPNRATAKTTGAQKLKDLIDNLEKEHAFIGEAFDRIRQLSRNYQVPEDGCGSYRLLFKMLPDFEEDLHQHIHLENNILFPKAIERESNDHAD